MKVPLKTIYYKLGPTPDAVRMYLNRHDIPYTVEHNRIMVSFSDIQDYRPRRTYAGKPTGVQEAIDDLERQEAEYQRKQENQWREIVSLDELLDKELI